MAKDKKKDKKKGKKGKAAKLVQELVEKKGIGKGSREKGERKRVLESVIEPKPIFDTEPAPEPDPAPIHMEAAVPVAEPEPEPVAKPEPESAVPEVAEAEPVTEEEREGASEGDFDSVPEIRDVPAHTAANAGKHAIRTSDVSFTMPDEETLFGLSNLFKIFADPTRLKILFSLVESPKCVTDISAESGVTQGATSHQLRSMKQERVVDFVRDGKQVIYSLADDRVQNLLAQGLAYIDE